MQCRKMISLKGHLDWVTSMDSITTGNGLQRVVVKCCACQLVTEAIACRANYSSAFIVFLLFFFIVSFEPIWPVQQLPPPSKLHQMNFICHSLSICSLSFTGNRWRRSPYRIGLQGSICEVMENRSNGGGMLLLLLLLQLLLLWCCYLCCYWCCCCCEFCCGCSCLYYTGSIALCCSGPHQLCAA